MIRNTVYATIGMLAVFALAKAQRVEISVLAGGARSTAEVTASPNFTSASAGASPSFQVGFAYRLLETSAGHLWLEVPVTWASQGSVKAGPDTVSVSGGHNVFATPGARFSFLPRSRFRPYVAEGIGAGSINEGVVEVGNSLHITVSTGVKPVADFGGGVEIRATRSLGFRGEIRDFVTLGSGLSGRNHAVYAGGIALHF
jgi:hypothetical protein